METLNNPREIKIDRYIITRSEISEIRTRVTNTPLDHRDDFWTGYDIVTYCVTTCLEVDVVDPRVAIFFEKFLDQEVNVELSYLGASEDGKTKSVQRIKFMKLTIYQHKCRDVVTLCLTKKEEESEVGVGIGDIIT